MRVDTPRAPHGPARMAKRKAACDETQMWKVLRLGKESWASQRAIATLSSRLTTPAPQQHVRAWLAQYMRIVKCSIVCQHRGCHALVQRT